MSKEEDYKKINLMYSFIIICYVICEGFFGYGFTSFIFKKGINLAKIGLLMGLTNFAIMLFDYPSGNIADKYGRKKICSSGFIIYGIGLIIFGFSNNFALFLISGIVRAFGSSLISGTPEAWYLGELSKINKFSYKDKFLPIIRGIGLFFGSVSGIMAGKVSEINISLPIYIGGIIMIVSGVIIGILFVENYGNREGNLIKTINKNSVNFFRNSKMRILSVFEVLKTIMFTIFILLWQIFTTKVIGLSHSKLGYFYTAMLLLMSLSSFFSRYLMKKLNKITVTILGLFFISFGLIIFIYSKNIYLFILGFVIFEFSLGIANTSYFTWVYDYIPEEVRATYSSALNSVRAFSGFIMSVFLGKVIQDLGYNTGWIIALVSTLISIIWLLKIHKNDKNF